VISMVAAPVQREMAQGLRGAVGSSGGQVGVSQGGQLLCMPLSGWHIAPKVAARCPQACTPTMSTPPCHCLLA